MPRNQLALLELTEAIRTADDGKLMRTLLHTILQALVDTEATGHIEPACTSTTTTGPPSAALCYDT